MYKRQGLVGIGYVRSGILERHENVEIYPNKANGIVRSLQVMDDDVDRALTGGQGRRCTQGG